MTELLVRMFVKDKDNTSDIGVRTSYGILASMVGILSNILLFIGKFLVGLLMSSLAVVADAFNNLTDAASSVVSFIGVKMAGKPADREHPFGHGRIEYIAAFIVSIFVIQVGLSFLKSSIDQFIKPSKAEFVLIPFILLLASMLVKLWLALFNRKLGRRINSQVMLATAADSMGDIVTTSVTALSVVLTLVLPDSAISLYFDAAAGSVVALLIIISGIKIAKDALMPLIGERAPKELYQKITDEVNSFVGIYGTHDLIIHNYGPSRYMATIHAEVPNDADIEMSHEIIDRAEREVSKKLGIFLVIHMDPIEMKDKEVVGTRIKVEQLLHALDKKLSCHDFRMVNGEHKISLIFDVVVPTEYSDKESEKVRHQIEDLTKQIDPRFECVITMDKDYAAG